jgi:hypothetical protein
MEMKCTTPVAYRHDGAIIASLDRFKPNDICAHVGQHGRAKWRRNVPTHIEYADTLERTRPHYESFS